MDESCCRLNHWKNDDAFKSLVHFEIAQEFLETYVFIIKEVNVW